MNSRQRRFVRRHTPRQIALRAEKQQDIVVAPIQKLSFLDKLVMFFTRRLA